MECDTLGTSIRATLMQGGRLISYFSKGFKGNELLLSTYKKEFLVLVSAI